MKHSEEFQSLRVHSARSDARTSGLIETGVRMVTMHGSQTAQTYLRDQGVSPETVQRVLGPDGYRRKPPYASQV